MKYKNVQQIAMETVEKAYLMRKKQASEFNVSVGYCYIFTQLVIIFVITMGEKLRTILLFFGKTGGSNDWN